MRVVTLGDLVTIHNTIPDQGSIVVQLNYFPETDSLYIDLAEKPSSESREISDGIVLDYDAGGNLVGIDIDKASLRVDLGRLVLSKLPGEVVTVAA